MSTTARSNKRKDTPTEAAEETVEKKNKSEPRQIPVHLNPADHSQFDNFLFEILLYRSTHQNFNVGRDEYPQLHGWLQHIKREYKQFAKAMHHSAV